MKVFSQKTILYFPKNNKIFSFLIFSFLILSVHFYVRQTQPLSSGHRTNLRPTSAFEASLTGRQMFRTSQQQHASVCSLFLFFFLLRHAHTTFLFSLYLKHQTHTVPSRRERCCDEWSVTIRHHMTLGGTKCTINKPYESNKKTLAWCSGAKTTNFFYVFVGYRLMLWRAFIVCYNVRMEL